MISAKTTMKLDRRFKNRVKARFEKYDLQVGVLQDRTHKNVMPKHDGVYVQTSYAGGPTRKASRYSSGQTIAEVSESARKTTGINFYTRPFKMKANRDILKFVKSFFRLVAGHNEKKRLENTMQAIVRNPILRGDYGGNTTKTTRAKGFSRLLIDTAQLFKNIKAKATVRGV